MQAVKHHGWIISVHAKAKNFRFKFRGSGVLPNCRFSFMLKFQDLILKIKSEVEPESKFRRFLGKFCSARGVKKLAVVKKKSKFQNLKVGFPKRKRGWFTSQIVLPRLSQYMVLSKLNGLFLLALLPFFLYMVRSQDLNNFLILLAKASGNLEEHS
ncbi:hypothetical protein NE237_003758 [Protea cynaroides]|uniref:Uncharacterized protein n=1 Tax=Protea cynaroides TaxID=273540 RepID=A0A9Q0KI39_9MAGN|nr:hypothetical protein NE237_003758 [Protea cynaroides]